MTQLLSDVSVDIEAPKHLLNDETMLHGLDHVEPPIELGAVPILDERHGVACTKSNVNVPSVVITDLCKIT